MRRRHAVEIVAFSRLMAMARRENRSETRIHYKTLDFRKS
jgi:uncharacterized membrane protein